MPLGQFGDVSSLKINQFKWLPNGCSFLGSSVSPDMSDLYKWIMTPHLKASMADLDPLAK